MRQIAFWLIAIASVAGVLSSTMHASGQARRSVFAPILRNQKFLMDSRDWRLISVAHEEGNLHSFAAILGNDAAISAYRDGKLPFPDGAIIARFCTATVTSRWRRKTAKVFGGSPIFRSAGTPTRSFRVIPVKDSKKYATTGGWGFAHFDKDGKPGTEAVLKTCAPCHAKASRDFVFTLDIAPSAGLLTTHATQLDGANPPKSDLGLKKHRATNKMRQTKRVQP